MEEVRTDLKVRTAFMSSLQFLFLPPSANRANQLRVIHTKMAEAEQKLTHIDDTMDNYLTLVLWSRIHYSFIQSIDYF